jgi:hypothetical protein
MLAPESHHRVVLIAKSGAPVPVRVHVDRRARRVSVRIDAHAREAVATAPAPRHARAAIAFAAERVEWIAKRLGALPLPVTFQPGALIPFRGVVHRLQRSDTGQTVRVERSTAIPVWRCLPTRRSTDRQRSAPCRPALPRLRHTPPRLPLLRPPRASEMCSARTA